MIATSKTGEAEERVRLEEKLERNVRAYFYVRNGKACDGLDGNINTVGSERVMRIGRDQELGRSVLPASIEELNTKLASDDLLPWQRECFEAKRVMFTAMRDNTNPVGSPTGFVLCL